jgi:cytochrome bd-type quinol oxidase subunit 2
MKKLIYTIFLGLLLINPSFALAAPTPEQQINSVNYTQLRPNVVKATTGAQLLANLINTFIGLLGVIALVMFVYAGFKWIMAGTSDDTKESRNMMKNAAIGMFIVLISYSLANFVFDTLKKTSGATTPPAANGTLN